MSSISCHVGFAPSLFILWMSETQNEIGMRIFFTYTHICVKRYENN